MSDFVDSYSMLMLSAYFLFLFSLIYMSRNVEKVAQHPLMENVADKVRYNLRNIPRVDYTEISSEDSQSESQEVTSEFSQEESDEPSLRKRRNRNAITNLLDQIQ